MSGEGVKPYLRIVAPILIHFIHSSYDLDMDTRLSEETTTLVESYVVRHPTSAPSFFFLPALTCIPTLSSYRMAG